MQALTFTFAVILAVMTGCTMNGTGNDPNDPGSSGNHYEVTKDDRIPFVPQDDTQFIDVLIPHHEMAVMMADMEMQHGAGQEVMAMAQRMKTAQLAEIDQMKETRMRIAGSDEVPAMTDDHMDRDMRMMEAEQGAALDRLFLENMLPHHAGALQIAHNALPNLEESDMRALAEKVIRDQTEEIAEIHSTLNGL